MYIKYILYINIKNILISIFNRNFNEYLTKTWPSQVIYFLVKGLAMWDYITTYIIYATTDTHMQWDFVLHWAELKHTALCFKWDGFPVSMAGKSLRQEFLGSIHIHREDSCWLLTFRDFTLHLGGIPFTNTHLKRYIIQ